MSTETQRAELPPLPEMVYLGDDASYGYDAECMRDYARDAQASQAAALKADMARQATEIERLNDLLSFVERWANHHGRKPSVSAENALSVIQHHPDIKEITKSYTDGVVSTTRDPYAEIEALRKDADRWRHWREGRGLQVVVPTPTEEKQNKVTTIIYGPCREPAYGEALDAAIDAAMQTKEAS